MSKIRTSGVICYQLQLSVVNSPLPGHHFPILIFYLPLKKKRVENNWAQVKTKVPCKDYDMRHLYFSQQQYQKTEYLKHAFRNLKSPLEMTCETKNTTKHVSSIVPKHSENILSREINGAMLVS